MSTNDKDHSDSGSGSAGSTMALLTLVQNLSGIAFTTFAALHFTGHSIVPFVSKLDEADRVMNLFRYG